MSEVGPGLADGEYEAFILDTTADPANGDAVSTIDVTIVTGPHKGEVLTLAVSGLGRSDIDLLGLPATLTITDGNPLISIDD